MAYAKFDDGFIVHDKVRPLSDGAFRLHVSGIVHSSRFLLDGRLSAETLPDLMRRYRSSYLAELVDRGLWVEIMPGALYEIHDYLEWNDSRAKVEARRQRNADRIAKWRAEHGKDV